MTKYKLVQIKLTPITPYFFGKEAFHQLGNKTDYFQHSLDFPQQTTLLGLLRHKLLRDNGIDLDATHPKNAKNLDIVSLIGASSFQVNNDNINVFGNIKGISPCYIIDNNNQKYFYENNETSNGESVLLNESRDAFLKGTEKYIGKFQFDEKIGTQEYSNCFHNSVKVGIHKGGVKAKVRDESYFIMEYKQLGQKEQIAETDFNKFKKWSFAFQAILSQDVEINEAVDIMPMGKERSLFRIETTLLQKEIEEEKFELKADEALKSDILECILLSDTRLSQDDLNTLSGKCIMQITNKQRVRYIKRNTQKYYLGEKPTKEAKAFNLIAKGSVLFIKKENKDKVEQLLNKAKDFKQIGYNYFYFKNA